MDLESVRGNRSKRAKKKSGLAVLVTTSREYASATTAHGIPYIAEDGRSLTERMLWVIVVSLAVTFTAFQMTTLYEQWQDDPVVTTLDTVALPIEEIEFPAVTICPQGSVNKIMETVLFQQLKDYITKKRVRENKRPKRSDDPQDADVQRTNAPRLQFPLLPKQPTHRFPSLSRHASKFESDGKKTTLICIMFVLKNNKTITC